MKEPIFLELAHACLKVVEPEKFQPELGKLTHMSRIPFIRELVLFIQKLMSGSKSGYEIH